MKGPLFLTALLTLAIATFSMGQSSQPASAQAKAGGEDWPHFNGPYSNDFAMESIRKDWNTQPPKMLWKVEMTDEGYAGVSMAAGKVFVIDHKSREDIVRAFDFGTGKELWRFSYDEAPNSKYGFARSTPTYDNGKLYTLSREGSLHCLDASSGTKLWSLKMATDLGGKKPVHSYTASPLVLGNKLIVLPGGQSLFVALDKNTGKVLWRSEFGGAQPGYSTPFLTTVAGKNVLLGYSCDTFVAVDPENGKLVWSFPWKTPVGNNVAAPLPMGDSIFIATGDNKGCAMLDVMDGQLKARWENKALRPQFPSPVQYRGKVYGTSDPGDLVCLDPQSGKVQWRQKGFEKGSVVAVEGGDGAVLLAFEGKTGDMVMVALDETAYKELGRFTPLGGQSWTPPIVAHGKLIIRNCKTLACFDLK